MSRSSSSASRLVVYAVLVLVIAGAAGGFVFRLLFGGGEVAPVEPPVVAVRPPPRAVADAGDATPRPVEATVAAVSGTAERQRAGVWTKLEPGATLAIDETVRTGPDGRVDVVVGDAQSRITISERTEVTVAELSAAVHRFKLSKGRLAVDYVDAERVLKIEAERSGSVATTRGARFAVLASGTTVAVATERGGVTLQNSAGTVEVGAGKQSVVGAGDQAPSAPAPIPVEVLLEVAARAKAQACATLSGTVQPGSEVAVDGRPVELKPNGAFEVSVPAAPGRKQVTVTVKDTLGREKQRLVACAQLDEGPSHVEIDWGEKK